ncbi:MAG: nucleotidyltransferase family protein, partial [Methylococcaceae bacterium]
MSVANQTLQRLLLDLLSPLRPVDQQRLTMLGAAEWSVVMRSVRQHRLGPMLHWQLSRGQSHLDVPGEIRSVLAQSYTKSTLRSLTLQRELLIIHKILTQAKIPYIALKGAYLAYHAYPQAGLRPLRDLDILVPKEQVLAAYEVLLAAGLTRIDDYLGTPDAALLLYKHLPPLRSCSGQAIVELHARLYDQNCFLHTDPSDDSRFWERCITAPLAQEQITYESPTDCLLHMIFHAVYEHQFNNGPLLLPDLAFLMTTQIIDWDLFWTIARQEQQMRGYILALKLTQRYWDVGHIDWPSEVDGTVYLNLEAALAIAESLMLQDVETHKGIGLHLEVFRAEGLAAKGSVLLRKVFRPKIFIAGFYPVRAEDWRVYLWYPVYWLRLITERLPDLWKTRQQSDMHEEINHVTDLQPFRAFLKNNWHPLRALF